MIAGPLEVEIPALSVLRSQHLTAFKIHRARRKLALYAKTPEAAALRRMDALKCSMDFIYWLANWGVIRMEAEADPLLRDVPFVPWPSQVVVADWLADRVRLGQLGLIRKSREIGVSWLVLHYIWWGWRYKGRSALLGSRVEIKVDRKGDLDSLFEKIRYIHDRQPPHVTERRTRSNYMLFQNLRTSAAIRGESTNDDFGRGGRSGIAFVDEFAAIPPRLQESTVRGLESVAAARILVGNPAGTMNTEHHLFQSLAPEQVLLLKWDADPYRDEAWKRSKLLPVGALTPEQFAREYEGDATALGSGNLIFSFREEVVLYDETTPEWARKKDAARATWFCAGGWDFGSGPSLLCNALALVDYGETGARPDIWLDNEVILSQTDWQVAAASSRQKMADYGGMCTHFGDPAGIQRDSAQTSWESNLRAGRIPLFCLDVWYNTSEGREWEIKLLQAMIDEGRFHVHRRCRVITEALKNWKRNIKDWLKIDEESRAMIAPRKDGFSHPMEAVLYMVAGVVFYASKARTVPKEMQVPTRVEQSMGRIFQGIRR